MNNKLNFPPWEPEKWKDLPENPLITPVNSNTPGAVAGDPQILLPGEFDEQWHMFLTGNGHFYRYDSPDGLKWNFIYDKEWAGGPCCITSDGKRWLVYYTFYTEGKFSCVINARTSDDLIQWSEPFDIIHPEFTWEMEGERIQVRNPCLVRLSEKRYRLYYSGGTVWMHDMNFEEPKYIGFAESDNVLGPFRKHEEPVLIPDKSLWYRNYGAGAMRVYGFGDNFLGIADCIYIDEENRSRSALNVLLSEDGISWHDASYNPIIQPGEAWKKAMVYQLDLVFFQKKLWLFYNARDGWDDGMEQIGASSLDWEGEVPKKMWVLPDK